MQQPQMFTTRDGFPNKGSKLQNEDYLTPITKSIISNHKTMGYMSQTPQIIDNPITNLKSPTAASMFNRHEKRARSIALNVLNSDTRKYRSKGGSPGGVYLQDSQRNGFEESSVVDFIKKNQSMGKDYKNMDFERQKQLIHKMYAKIKGRKDYGLDLNNLYNIQSCLNPKVKHHFVSNQGFYEIFQEANILNQTFLTIIDQVCCYRLELGTTLQKLVESYNSIILQQFEEFYKSESDKDKEVHHKLIYQQQATEELIQKRLEYERKLESVQAVISSKDAQISSLQEVEEQLEKEVKYLREMLALGGSAAKVMDPVIFEQKEAQKKSFAGGEQKGAKEEFTNNIEDLNDVLRNLEKEQNEKKNILNGMDRLLKTMLKTTKQTVGTQVEEGELFWKPTHYAGSEVLYKQNTKQIPASRELLVEGNASQQQLHDDVVTKTKLIYQPPIENYGNTQKIMMAKDLDKLNELEQKLNLLTTKAKTPDQQQQEEQYQWSIPHHILVFIANSLEENQSGRVLPWQEFKQVIYDIYDHRIMNGNEIGGIINNSYVALEEYILLYCLDKHKLRRLAEIKLIEILTSLKYYVDIWPRAKTFAYLMNILQTTKQEVNIHQRKSNGQHIPEELDIPNVDIYIQEFFLHSYSIIMQEKERFLESKDGVTYVKVQYEEHATQQLMTWFGDQDSRKWFHKVRRNVKKIKTNALDDFETDYIDVDVLINLYVDEYKTKKKTNQKNLSKEFMKKYQEQEGLFNTDEVDKIVLACLPSSSSSAFVKYPGSITIRRAFLYSLVCGENGFDINTQEFIAGCNRFGIDNPSPIVTKRIGMYGNDEDFEEIIKKELIKANILQQSKVHTSKQNKFGFKLESARLSTSTFKKNDNFQQQSSSPRGVSSGIQNLKLIGKTQTQDLDSGLIMAGGIKMNIGQLGKDMGDNQTRIMTQQENSINNKKIIIPSFSTTSALFSQHFSILRDLKKRIEGLKQAYYNQREDERSWEQVEKILHVLEAACKFLDFPIQS